MLAHELRNPLAPIRNAVRARCSLRGRRRRRLRAAASHRPAGPAHGAPGGRPAGRLPHHPRQDRAAPRAARPRRDGRRGRSRPSGRSSTAAATRSRVTLAGRPLWLRGRPGPAGAGARQPAEQRRQVHRAGRPDRAGVAPRRRRGRGPRRATTASASPPEMLPHVFDLFTQADRRWTAPQGGLGIGLTLVQQPRRAARRPRRGAQRRAGPGERVHRPPARSRRAPGRGPRRRRRRPATPTAPRPRRILVVDDNVDAAASLARHPACWGHTVAAGPRRPGGAGRWRGAPARTWCCWTSACPGMDGYEVARRLRGRAAPRPRHAGRAHRLRPGRGPRALPRGRLRPPPGQARPPPQHPPVLAGPEPRLDPLRGRRTGIEPRFIPRRRSN